MSDKPNIMEKIELNKIPEKWINKFKREYIINQKNQYNLMGIDFDLSDLEIEENIKRFFSKCIFFYSPYYFCYYYAEIKKFN